MDEIEFEELVAQALDDLPIEFKEKLENIAIVVEAKPPREVLERKDIGYSGTLLGLYQGVPLPKRGYSYGNVLPDKITIFQKPIEYRCRTKEQMQKVVREVVIHEIGHYFGLDEKDMPP